MPISFTHSNLTAVANGVMCREDPELADPSLTYNLDETCCLSDDTQRQVFWCQKCQHRWQHQPSVCYYSALCVRGWNQPANLHPSEGHC